MVILKRLFYSAASISVMTVAMCATQDLYNKYAHNKTERTKLKNKIKKLNPFNKVKKEAK